jgi:hypothetical protein
MRAIPVLLFASTCWAGDAFGIWKVSATRSVDPYPNPGSLTVRFDPHTKGEVFTVDRTNRDGRATTLSTLLYFDGQPRHFQDLGCLGTQSSRRVDRGTVEILRQCGSGEWTRFVRRISRPNELVLEITEQRPDGLRLERRLVLVKK